MRHAAIPAAFSLAMAVGLLPPRSLVAQLVQPPIEELRREVEQKERELSEAQVAASSARAQLARAEGKLELAAEEWRKVLLHRESRLGRVRDLVAQGRICDAGPLEEAQGAVAVGRVWLADVEGRRDVPRVELPKVIAYYEWRTRRYENLLRCQAIPEKEARETLEEIGEELRRAQRRFSALQGDPGGVSAPPRR
jgi:hypothetical protein